MTITLNSNDRAVVSGTFGAVDSISGGTATAIQMISVTTALTKLAGSTATTSFNQHKLVIAGSTGTPGGSSATTPIPVEGLEKWIHMEGTGPGWKVVVEGIASGNLPGFLGSSTDSAVLSTPTGAFVMDTRDDFLHMKYVNERWWVLAGFATFATST